MNRTLLEACEPPRAGSPPVVPSAEVLLSYQPESVSHARRLVRETLTGWGLSQLIDTAALAQLLAVGGALAEHRVLLDDVAHVV
ncbi:hypothetical protein AB0O00_18775, partial [Kitasatospora sp. NPDC093558]